MFPNSTQKSAVLWDKINSLSASYNSSSSTSSSSSSSPSPIEHQLHSKQIRNRHPHNTEYHYQSRRNRRSFEKRRDTVSRQNSSKFIDYFTLPNIGGYGTIASCNNSSQSGISNLTRRLSIRPESSSLSKRLGFSCGGSKSSANISVGLKKFQSSSGSPPSSSNSQETSHLQNLKLEMTKLLRNFRRQ